MLSQSGKREKDKRVERMERDRGEREMRERQGERERERGGWVGKRRVNKIL